MSRILSGDLPRSRWLAAALVLVVLGLAFAPWLFPGSKALNVAAKMLVFIVLVSSYDLLLGYTGIVSFAHTMFFGIGAYGVAIASTRLGEGWLAVGVGLVAALACSLLLSLVMPAGRVSAIFTPVSLLLPVFLTVMVTGIGSQISSSAGSLLVNSMLAFTT